MHARKDRRILGEKRHGGCAEARERTAAQQETVSGRKGPQARAIAFSGHNPRGTRRAQHGIFGERSFCRLRHLHGLRALDIVGPIALFGPVTTEPRDDFIVFLGGERFTGPDSGKETTVRSTVAPNGGFTKFFCRAKAFRESQKMVCKLGFHGVVIVGCIPLCNRKEPIRLWRGIFPMMPA